jgi:hypothetical protein
LIEDGRIRVPGDEFVGQIAAPSLEVLALDNPIQVFDKRPYIRKSDIFLLDRDARRVKDRACLGGHRFFRGREGGDLVRDGEGFWRLHGLHGLGWNEGLRPWRQLPGACSEEERAANEGRDRQFCAKHGFSILPLARNVKMAGLAGGDFY